MFTLDATIDAVQTGKKQFVSTFVQNEAIAKALNSFVDAQTEYTKKAVKVGTDTFTSVTSEAVKVAQDAAKEAGKFDFAKLNETFAKTFTVKK